MLPRGERERYIYNAVGDRKNDCRGRREIKKLSFLFLELLSQFIIYFLLSPLGKNLYKPKTVKIRDSI